MKAETLLHLTSVFSVQTYMICLQFWKSNDWNVIFNMSFLSKQLCLTLSLPLQPTVQPNPPTTPLISQGHCYQECADLYDCECLIYSWQWFWLCLLCITSLSSCWFFPPFSTPCLSPSCRKLLCFQLCRMVYDLLIEQAGRGLGGLLETKAAFQLSRLMPPFR